MDYYKEIKKELLDNEINRRVKNYSINKSDLNAYFTPYVILPVANGNLEIMGQFGVCDILDNMYFTGKVKVGYRKTF